MSDIGKRIRIKREQIGYTQEELATLLGYKNKSTIAKIENGTNDITQKKVVEFANVLNTTVAYLMGWEKKSDSELNLSTTEKHIIVEYRKADDITQAMVLRALSIDEKLNAKGDEEKMA